MSSQKQKTQQKLLKTAHSTEKPEKPRDQLNNKQRALAALLASRSVAEAAKQAGVGDSTLRRWLRDDDEFRNNLRDRREDALEHVALRLQERASEAVEALFDHISSKEKVEPGRAAMLRTALDFAFRAGSYSDLADRIADLEAESKKEKSNHHEEDPNYEPPLNPTHQSNHPPNATETE